MINEGVCEMVLSSHQQRGIARSLAPLAPSIGKGVSPVVSLHPAG